MGLLSVDLLITLQILPVFFSNCLFLALYDSVVLLKHMVLLLSRSKAARCEWRRMLTSEGLRCVWNSFLLDAYKQVSWRTLSGRQNFLVGTFVSAADRKAAWDKVYRKSAMKI